MENMENNDMKLNMLSAEKAYFIIFESLFYC